MWCFPECGARGWSAQRRLMLFLAPLALVPVAACETTSPGGVQAEAGAPPPVPSPQQAVSPDGAASIYRLHPGDALSINVWDHPKLTMEVVVAPDGRFQYPLVGEVQAAGVTLPGLGELMTDLLADHLVSPQVSVSLVSLPNYNIYVLGEVAQPGVFKVGSPVTVIQAIAMAGGFTVFASRDDIVVYNPRRGQEPQQIFNYHSFLDAPEGRDIVLSPGDTVIVR